MQNDKTITINLWARYKDWASETDLRTRMTIIGMWTIALGFIVGMSVGTLSFCFYLWRGVNV